MMTGLPMHEKEFSRRSFVKGGGALVVGFSIARRCVGASAGDARPRVRSRAIGPYDP